MRIILLGLLILFLAIYPLAAQVDPGDTIEVDAERQQITDPETTNPEVGGKRIQITDGVHGGILLEDIILNIVEIFLWITQLLILIILLLFFWNIIIFLKKSSEGETKRKDLAIKRLFWPIIILFVLFSIQAIIYLFGDILQVT